MTNLVEINVQSEIGELEGVILHTPGSEVENMTPQNAARALYSDILNLEIANEEYRQHSGVLGKIANTYQVKDLLANILKTDSTKEEVIKRLVRCEPHIVERGNTYRLYDHLLDQTPEVLAKMLIEGVELERDSLTSFLSDYNFALSPLHNFFFTRDASMTLNNEVLIGSMANKVRDRESMIMQSIFDFTPEFKTKTVSAVGSELYSPELNMEGGDILIARDDILIIGNGCRTTTKGVDFILSQILAQKESKVRHLVIQELPESPESFIHMDMVFTLLDKNKCMVFEPLILQPNKYQTVHIAVQDGKILKIEREHNVLTALKKLGMDLEPVFCGGESYQHAEREQWHSGANFFSVGEGKVMGYSRNLHTIDAMNNAGFEPIKANDVISGARNLNDYEKYVVTIDGSELPRGGGGCRCMTMPIRRKSVQW